MHIHTYTYVCMYPSCLCVAAEKVLCRSQFVHLPRNTDSQVYIIRTTVVSALRRDRKREPMAWFTWFFLSAGLHGTAATSEPP